MDCKLCGKELIGDCENKFGICANDIQRIGDMMNIGKSLFGA